MKFASTAKKGRGQMRERQRRERTLTPSMRAVYPQLGVLRIEFEFSDSGPFTPAPQTAVLHPPAQAYFVYPCPYSDCDGEFDLRDAVAAMIAAGDVRCEGQQRCGGHRSGDGSNRIACSLELEFQMEAKSP